MNPSKKNSPRKNAGKNGSGDGSKKSDHPFRSAVIRGLGVVTPPLLTIVIFLWVGSTVQQYVLRPMTNGVCYVLIKTQADIRPDPIPLDTSAETRTIDDKTYWRTSDDKLVPLEVYDRVRNNQGSEPLPVSAWGIYERNYELTKLQPYVVIPAFLSVFILVLYLSGKFIAAGVGRLFVTYVEQGILSLPLVRNVYSSVKQVSDFLFSPREIEYTRVVAVEYPRKGIWSIGLVTGESMIDIRSAANEPVLSILVPTSPMPVTGYTINVKKSEAIDLDITIDQAFQFIVSCGVVVPPQQVQNEIDVPPIAPQLSEDTKE